MKLASAVKYVNPTRLLSEAKVVSGELPLSALPRLVEMGCKVDERTCKYTFSATRGEMMKVCLKGNVECEVSLVCQRCMGPLIHKVDVSFEVYPVNESELDSLPKHFDPVVLDAKGSINVVELVEEEIMLSIPLTPKHNEIHCK